MGLLKKYQKGVVLKFQKGGNLLYVKKYQTGDTFFSPSDYKKIGDEQVVDVVEKQTEDGLEKTIYKIQWYLAQKEIENEIKKEAENTSNLKEIEIQKQNAETEKKKEEAKQLWNNLVLSDYFKNQPVDFKYKDIKFPTDYKIVPTQEEYDKLNLVYEEAKRRNDILKEADKIRKKVLSSYGWSTGDNTFSTFITGKDNGGGPYSAYLKGVYSGDLSKVRAVLDPDVQATTPGALMMINTPTGWSNPAKNPTLGQYIENAKKEGLVPINNKLYRWSEGEYYPIFRQTIPILQENINKQIMLKKLGFDIGKVDGIWGTKSQQAWDNLTAQMKIENPNPEILPSNPIPSNPKVLTPEGSISPRMQTILQFNPETGRHEVIDVRVQKDAFINLSNGDDWEFNDQPILYYNPETKEYSEKPNYFKFKKGGNLLYKKGGSDIKIDPKKKGTFKAQATKMGMGVQEAASKILANKEKYSPAMVKKANFAKNFAK